MGHVDDIAVQVVAPKLEYDPDRHEVHACDVVPPEGFAYPAVHEYAAVDKHRPTEVAPVELVVCPDGHAVQDNAPSYEK